MNVIQLLIVIWLGASCCATKFINESSKYEDLTKLEAVTVNILLTCYETRWNTVGIAGTSESSLFKTLSSQQSFAITLIGNETYNGPFTRGSRNKLQLFIVTASTSDQLNKTLRHVKNSRWWNHMATFLILDWQSTSTKATCSNAYDYMWTSWEMDLLEAKYLCVHETRGTLIYTYNPFTQNAPEPWHLENTYKGKNEHPWTTFSRKYDIENELCENLEFEKTNDVAGYEIRGTAAYIPPDWTRHSKNYLDLDSSNAIEHTFFRYIFNALNATVRLQISPNLQKPGSVDTKGNDILNGRSDIQLDARFLGLLNFTFSSPAYEIELNIITQHRGQESQLQKLLTVLDRSSRIGLCLVAFKLVIFFKFLRRETLGEAILNTLRLFTNSGLTKVPTNQGARIFMASVFILVVTIIGIYQGLLASLLTKPKPLKNVETLEDLAKSGYAIHGHEIFAPFFMTPEFKNRFVGHSNGSSCLPLVLKDSSSACVGSKLFVFTEAAELNLHIAREFADKSPIVLVIRDDWPLEERLNKVLGAMINGDIIARLFDETWKKSENIENSNKLLMENAKPEVMTLNDLSFVFVILGIGLSITAVIFFFEVASFSLFPKIKNMWSKVRNRV